MIRKLGRGGLVAVLLSAFASPVAARGTAADTSRLTVVLGPSLDAHSDLLASPFRQSGVGMGVGVGFRRGGFTIDVEGATGGTSSSLDVKDGGVEDNWFGGVDVTWVRPAGRVGRTGLFVGGSIAGLAFVRRHHYGPRASREYYADMMIPLSLVGAAHRPLGSAGTLRDRLTLGLAAILYRSPFAAAKTVPTGSLAGPSTLKLVRNRLTVEWRTSPRTRLALTHALTFYDTDRHRPVRLVRQRVGVGLSFLLGGGR